MDDSNQQDSKDCKKFMRFRNIDVKTVLSFVMLVMVLALLLMTFHISKTGEKAYTVYLDEDKVGVVEEKENALKLIEKIEKELSDTYNITCKIDKNLKFKETFATSEDVSDDEELKDNIESKLTFLVSGYVLSIDGKEVGGLKTRKDAEEVVEKFKNIFSKPDYKDSKIKDIKILEDVSIEKKDLPLSKIKKMDEVLNIVKEGSNRTKIHRVEAGESLWTIAKLYDADVDEIIDANPNLDPEDLYPGDKVRLKLPEPLLTVEIVEEINYTKDIDYDIKTEKDDSMYKTQKKVKTEGVKGEKEIVARLVRRNGEKVDEKIIDEKIIKKPVDEIVVRGTKDVPRTMATGSLLLPTRGRISSKYGTRGSGFHRGIDIATSVGTPITAADGGTVTFAGYKGSYGKLVVIDHNNGYVTKYAHCNDIYVNVGQKVYKGEKIASVGATGNATGPHLHFEVLKNGQNVNPSAYLGR